MTYCKSAEYLFGQAIDKIRDARELLCEANDASDGMFNASVDLTLGEIDRICCVIGRFMLECEK